MPEYDVDLFVIGGGSGGVRCARIAATHGARVAIAEERYWGGTCVNVGCVPKKILVQASNFGEDVIDSHGFGWNTQSGTNDWAALIARKDAEIVRLNGIYVKLLEGVGVTHYDGRARLADAHTVVVSTAIGEIAVRAERIVIATGGRPTLPDIEGAGLGVVSDALFHLPERPQRIAILGSGYIGVEFAGIFAGLGSTVDLIYRQHLPLRGFDEELREALVGAIDARGIRQHRGATITRLREGAEGARIVTLDNGEELTVDLVLFATGRHPNTKGLGLDALGVRLDDGRVVVDEAQRSSVAHIYAIGDVTDRINLTPVAIAEGHNLADRLFGPPPPREWSIPTTPKAVFFTPPLASVGLTEAEAVACGTTDIYTTSFRPMRHTMSGRERRSLMKLVVDHASGRLLGAHMLGDDAPEMMLALAVAVTAGLTKHDLDRTVGIHPTSAEEWVTMRSLTRTVG